MSKSNKEEINYRLPDECCGVCKSSYYNTYGDACCERLEHHDVVHVGGVCDFFEREPEVVKPVVEEVKVEEEIIIERGTCENCKSSYWSGVVPMCSTHGHFIHDTLATCEQWEKE